ncbi:MAG: hypothetical protein AAFQ37_04015, partial [Bacteroidota bacterium]
VCVKSPNYWGFQQEFSFHRVTLLVQPDINGQTTCLIMRTLRLLFTLLLFAGFAYHAQAQLMLGGGISYGFQENSELGLQVRGVYSFAEEWRGQADFTFFLGPPENFSFWTINANGNYIFSDNGDGTVFYAIAGLNFANASVNYESFGSESVSEIGLNIGAGGNFNVADGLTIFAEAKYVISGFDQFVVAGGVLFPIGN